MPIGLNNHISNPGTFSTHSTTIQPQQHLTNRPNKYKYLIKLNREQFSSSINNNNNKMRSITLILLLLKTTLAGQPVYKYRYETEDVMKTAASNVPLRGYHVIEGGYYPSQLGEPLEPGLSRLGNIQGGYYPSQLGGALKPGLSRVGGSYPSQLGVALEPGLSRVGNIQGGYYPSQLGEALEPGLFRGDYYPSGIKQSLENNPQYQTAPITLIKPIVNGHTLNVPLSNGLQYLGDQQFRYIPSGMGPGNFGHSGRAFGPPPLQGLGGYGGESVEKSDFSESGKKSNDERYEKGQGKKGEEVNHGEEGFSEKEVALKDVKGDSGYYSNVDGEKKVYEDGKKYSGGHHFNNEGQNGAEKTAKQGHKKGHKIKSFKTSHHKDESGTDEQYYDEAHDEAGNYMFNGQSGKFGENAASSFKGGNQEEKYKVGENKKEGHHSTEHSVGEKQANQGKYGGNKFAGNEAVFGYKNGADEQSLLGHQEASKVYKTSPFIAPFHNY
ncbi:unnamed protein product [Phaedon cochleariae]|uniref:Uncharacterized protein n=1 Tax=Phaedon cochleariae TaxID=80249 RepID=A0A9P0DRB8_PHACE|nr:unnamed protein product [Phaedon cochleariae]